MSCLHSCCLLTTRAISRCSECSGNSFETFAVVLFLGQTKFNLNVGNNRQESRIHIHPVVVHLIEVFIHAFNSIVNLLVADVFFAARMQHVKYNRYNIKCNTRIRIVFILNKILRKGLQLCSFSIDYCAHVWISAQLFQMMVGVTRHIAIGIMKMLMFLRKSRQRQNG